MAIYRFLKMADAQRIRKLDCPQAGRPLSRSASLGFRNDQKLRLFNLRGANIDYPYTLHAQVPLLICPKMVLATARSRDLLLMLG